MLVPRRERPQIDDLDFYAGLSHDGGVGTWWGPTVHTSCLPGAWSENNIATKGSSDVKGEPTNAQKHQSGFYSGPWDALGMQQNDFWQWVGTPLTAEPASPAGIYYLDDDGVKQNKSGNFAYTGGTGEGLLYVDGDLHISGNFVYRGMIYVEGNLDINGDCWILGGLIVRGKDHVKIANGSATVLYSAEAIQQKISRHGGDIRTIAWREL